MSRQSFWKRPQNVEITELFLINISSLNSPRETCETLFERSHEDENKVHCRRDSEVETFWAMGAQSLARRPIMWKHVKSFLIFFCRETSWYGCLIVQKTAFGLCYLKMLVWLIRSVKSQSYEPTKFLEKTPKNQNYRKIPHQYLEFKQS